jgi:hypothetical protein
MKKIKLLALAAMLVSMLCFGCKQAAQTKPNQTKPSGNKQVEPPAPPSQDEQKPGQDEQNPGQDEQKPDQGQTPPANTYKITEVLVNAPMYPPEFELRFKPEGMLKEIKQIAFGGKDGRKVPSKWYFETDNDFCIENECIRMKRQNDGKTLSFKDKDGNILGTFKYRKITKTLEKVNP